MPANERDVIMSDTPTKILLLGGGFGGLYAAIELEKRLARDADVDITLVNRENFFSFTPMLHEVAASDLDVTHIVNPVRKMLKRTKLFLGDVQRIDLEEGGCGHPRLGRPLPRVAVRP